MSNDWNNDEWTIASVSTVTIHFDSAGGTDDVTNRYIPLQTNYAKQVVIRPAGQAITLHSINGKTTYKAPISVISNSSFTIKEGGLQITQLKIQTSVANTPVKIFAL